MPRQPRSSQAAFMANLAVFLAAAFLFAAPASAQPEIFPTVGVTWTVQPAFGQASAGRDNISGATCMTVPPGRSPCLVVNDSTTFVQLFSVSGNTIQAGAIVGLTSAPPPGTLADAPNVEGAAHDDRFFYIVTSRGKLGSVAQVDPSFLVARFTPDAAGRPILSVQPATSGIQISDRVRAALTAGIPIPQIAGQKLDRANAQIEGIAVKDLGRVRTVHLGFRAPVINGQAFILSMPAESLFATSGALDATVHPIALGPDVGVRDLAAVADGLLILAGPSPAFPGKPTLFHWSDSTGQLKKVAQIALPIGFNAETLLMLQDDPEFFRILVMFDGVTNGGPLEYSVPR